MSASNARLMISAARKSSGKTTVAIGLCASLRARGHRVAAFKKGPDYIDPMWLSAASGRPCINLDFHTMQHAGILQTFARYATRCDISIIEANKGLHDGIDVAGSDSSAALATTLCAPTLLVIDCEGITRGIAPLLQGLCNFDQTLDFAGVILNRVNGSRHEEKLRAAIERYTDVEVAGALPRQRKTPIEERHIGLIPRNEHTHADAVISTLRQQIDDCINVEQLMRHARRAPTLAIPTHAKPGAAQALVDPPVRIGVAHDRAFGFYYHDDLVALREAGAALTYIDLINDRELPVLDALFIGGGFPEMHLAELSANRDMREAVREQARLGLPIRAECGGLMYLCNSIAYRSNTHSMVGVLDADVVMHAHPQGRGNVLLMPTCDHPWSTATSTAIAGHEFHHSALINIAPHFKFAYRVLRGHGITGDFDGLIHRNVVASYSHIRDVAGHRWAADFVKFVGASSPHRRGAPALQDTRANAVARTTTPMTHSRGRT